MHISHADTQQYPLIHVFVVEAFFCGICNFMQVVFSINAVIKMQNNEKILCETFSDNFFRTETT